MLATAALRTVRYVERRAETPVLVVAASAWLVLLDLGVRGGVHHDAFTVVGVGRAASLWVVMTVAMMLPLTSPSLRYIGRMVPPSGRTAAIATFSTAFVAVWAPGAVLAVVVHPRLPAPGWLVAASFGLAAVWELTPVKRTALLRCHRNAVVRAAPPGRRRSCWAFGIRRGVWCVASCGPAMVALLFCGHALVPLVAVTLVLTDQQFAIDGFRRRGSTALAMVALAFVAPVLA